MANYYQGSPLDWYYNQHLASADAKKPAKVKAVTEAWGAYGSGTGANPLAGYFTDAVASGNLNLLNPASTMRNGISYGSGLATGAERNFDSVDDALWAFGIDRGASRDALNWQISQILDPGSAWASRTNLGLDFTTPEFEPFRQQYGTDPSKWSAATLDQFLNALGTAGLETNKYIEETKAADRTFGAILGNMMLAASPGLFGAAVAGFPGIPGLSGITGGGNPFSGLTDGLLGGGNANAVPGISTGVTTPAGGAAIVGTGQAAPLTGLLGGAPLGASPLAVAGGAAALPGVTPLPTGGTLPGTNINVGTPGNQSWWQQTVNNLKDEFTDPKSLARRVVTNAGSNLLQTALAPEAAAGAGAGGLLGNAGPGFASRPWPGNPYPGEIEKIPAYMRGLLAARMGSRMG